MESGETKRKKSSAGAEQVTRAAPEGEPMESKGVQASTEHARQAPTAEERHCMIAIAAYYRAERRAFAPGAELEDWVAAQAEIDELLAKW